VNEPFIYTTREPDDTEPAEKDWWAAQMRASFLGCEVVGSLGAQQVADPIVGWTFVFVWSVRPIQLTSPRLNA
jgi:hypothetical protein